MLFHVLGVLEFLRYVEFVHKIFSGFPKLVREFLINLCIGHPFVDVCKFELCVFLFVVVFVYLELADFTTMIACRDFIEPLRYDVCDVYEGCIGCFVASGHFVY